MLTFLRLLLAGSYLTTPVMRAKRVWSRPTPTLLPGNICVPRCLTRMVPALTACPAKRFTPSRFDWLSRPLRLEPPPFLCAIFGYSFSTAAGFLRRLFWRQSRPDYPVNDQSGILLSVPRFNTVPDFRLISEDNDLITPSISL